MKSLFRFKRNSFIKEWKTAFKKILTKVLKTKIEKKIDKVKKNKSYLSKFKFFMKLKFKIRLFSTLDNDWITGIIDPIETNSNNEFIRINKIIDTLF